MSQNSILPRSGRAFVGGRVSTGQMVSRKGVFGWLEFVEVFMDVYMDTRVNRELYC
jgi:hypothetical protein